MDKSDGDIILEYISGDDLMFDLLVKRYIKSIYNFACRIVGAEDASDITQEVFVKVWKNIKKYNPEKSFKTWIFTIANNTSIDYLRKKHAVLFSQLSSPDEHDDFESNLQSDLPLPDEEYFKNDQIKQINKLILTLPASVRSVIILKYCNDCTFSEIGTILGEPLDTVKSRHRRALIKLKEISRLDDFR